MSERKQKTIFYDCILFIFFFVVLVFSRTLFRLLSLFLPLKYRERKKSMNININIYLPRSCRRFWFMNHWPHRDCSVIGVFLYWCKCGMYLVSLFILFDIRMVAIQHVTLYHRSTIFFFHVYYSWSGQNCPVLFNTWSTSMSNPYSVSWPPGTWFSL